MKVCCPKCVTIVNMEDRTIKCDKCGEYVLGEEYVIKYLHYGFSGNDHVIAIPYIPLLVSSIDEEN